MSDETQEIIRAMRALGALDAQCDDTIPRSLLALGLRTYADRLEAARKRESGNAAAMRAALKRVLAAYKSGAIHTCAECYRDEWDDADWMMFLDWLFATEEGGAE